MDRSFTRWLPVLLLGAAVSCRRDDSNASADSAAGVAVVVPDSAGAVAVEAAPGPTGEVVLTVASTPGTGAFIVDAQGRAVYVLDTEPAASDTSWRPVTGRATAAPGDTTVNASQFGTRTRSDGTQQATYSGKPLYYYRGDQARNATTGRGKNGARLASPSGASGGATR